MRRFRAPVSFKDRPMKMRWLLVVVLIGLLFVLSPMAFASPPDPSWLGGFWDDADFDDVILHLTWCCPALSSGQPASMRRLVRLSLAWSWIATKTLSLAPLRSRTTPARLPPPRPVSPT